MGLVEQISKTHTHYQLTKLTKRGLNICNSLENCGIFKIFKDITLQNKQEFLELFNNELDKIYFVDSVKKKYLELSAKVINSLDKILDKIGVEVPLNRFSSPAKSV